ncbi:MAG: hypothetical protein ACOC4I_00440 [Spirochaetota bacterium]
MGQSAVFVFLVLSEVLLPGLQGAEARILESYVPVSTIEIQRNEDGLVGTSNSDVVFRTEQSRSRTELHLVEAIPDEPVLVDMTEILSRYRSADMEQSIVMEFETGDRLPFEDLSGPIVASRINNQIFMALPEHDLLFVIDVF